MQLKEAVRGWVLSKEIDDYLAAYNDAHRLTINLRVTADMIEGVARSLKGAPERAHAGIPTNWPTHGDLTEAVSKTVAATEMARRLYQGIPQETRKLIQSPANIGKTATRP